MQERCYSDLMNAMNQTQNVMTMNDAMKRKVAKDNFDRCCNFMLEMIKKYGGDVMPQQPVVQVKKAA